MSATPADRSAVPRWARRRRLLAALAALGAALTVWAIATQAAGLDLRSPAFSANGESAHIGAGLVAAASGLSGFAAWALLAALQRLTRRARPIWTACAAMALLVSLGAPLSGHGIDAGTRWRWPACTSRSGPSCSACSAARRAPRLSSSSARRAPRRSRRPPVPPGSMRPSADGRAGAKRPDDPQVAR